MLENHNIKVPKSLYINKKTKEIEKLIKENKLVFPLVVKPSI
jgi:glutathione synthase/RimK-type ligase-like ATP-grasp enzyme